MTEIKFIQIDEAKLTAIVESAVQRKFTEFKVGTTPSRKVRSLRELAKLLNISLSKVHQLKMSGVIPCFQDGRTLIFDLEQVELALNNYNKTKVKV